MTDIDASSLPSEAFGVRVAEGRLRTVPLQRAASGDRMRGRIQLAAIVFTLAYLVIIGRLVMFGIIDPAAVRGGEASAAVATGRPDLVDRNGEILATDIKMASLYGEPRNILDPDEATELITSVLPDLDAAALRKR